MRIAALTKPAPKDPKEVTAVINTIVSSTPQADFGMPASGRVRLASLRALPMITGGMSAVAGQKCAVDQDLVTGYRYIVTDVTVATGAFPGTSAWSPPS